MLLEVSLKREPTQSAYDQLLTFASERCGRLLLIVRKELGLSSTGEEFLEKLKPHHISRRSVSEWPGTRLLRDTALMIESEFSSEVAAMMMRTASRLFAWRQPALPEDPCLISDEGEPWLVTVSHERDAFLRISPGDLRRMRIEAPELFGCLGRVP